MKKSKADPRKPPIEDLQGQVYQHELGDPDRAEQIDRVLEVWRRKTSAKKRSRARKARSRLRKQAARMGSRLLPHKHLLVPVDASEVSERAIAYVAEMMHGRQDLRVLLLHVPRPVPPQLLEFGGRENPAEEKMAEDALQDARADWIEREQSVTQPVFAHAKAMLREAGVPDKVVETHVVAWNPNESLESAILQVAHEKECGTVVVGYAAFSWFQELLHLHLADVLLQKAPRIAIWVVH